MNNMERLPADTFFLDLELRQEVERMASWDMLRTISPLIWGWMRRSLSLTPEGKGPPCIPLCAREH